MRAGVDKAPKKCPKTLIANNTVDNPSNLSDADIHSWIDGAVLAAV